MLTVLKLHKRYHDSRREYRLNETRKISNSSTKSAAKFGVQIIHPWLLRQLSETLPTALIYDFHGEDRRLRGS